MSFQVWQVATFWPVPNHVFHLTRVDWVRADGFWVYACKKHKSYIHNYFHIYILFQFLLQINNKYFSSLSYNYYKHIANSMRIIIIITIIIVTKLTSYFKILNNSFSNFNNKLTTNTCVVYHLYTSIIWRLLIVPDPIGNLVMNKIIIPAAFPPTIRTNPDQLLIDIIFRELKSDKRVTEITSWIFFPSSTAINDSCCFVPA